MGATRKISPEVFFTFILVVLGAVIVTVSLYYGFGTLGSPGPGLYPCFVGLAIIGLSLAQLVKTFKSQIGKSLFTRQTGTTFLLMIFTLGLWIIVMPWLGYIIVTFLVTFAIAKIMRLEGWWKPLSISLGTTLFIYLLFEVWLYIDLPKGLLGEIRRWLV